MSIGGALPDQKKFVIGLSVTGSDEYWALAVATLVSVKVHLDVAPSKILVATDQDMKFDLLKQLQGVFDCEIVKIVPRAFYQDLVPKMKGNYATYWKFDLFHALDEDDVLMYIDVDAFVIDKLNVTNIIEVLGDGEFQLAAVPSPRPVLERVAATRIRNPFDYFNAGILFGVRDARYEAASITDAYEAIMKFDTLNVFWHDQDMFNYMFRDDTFKLPYAYNVHTGYILGNFRAPYLVNGLASEDIDRSAKVAHVSGDFLLSRRYHPYKRQFTMLIDTCIGTLVSAGCWESLNWTGVRVALTRLRDNSTRTSMDYVLQCVGMRKRAFAAHYYCPNFKSALRKMKWFFNSGRR
jgi:hypothetical protein